MANTLQDPIALLTSDHKKLKSLFQDILKAEDKKERTMLFDKLYKQMDVHAQIEEEIFYIAIQKDSKTHGGTLEAYEEHLVVKNILNELKIMDKGSEQWKSKLHVLFEIVTHHIKEEETELLPDSKKVLTKDKMEELGAQMLKMKEKLLIA